MDYESFFELQKKYPRAVGNDFMLPGDLKRRFSDGLITVCADDRALFLFEKRNGFTKLHFRLMDKSATLSPFGGELAAFLTYREGCFQEIASEWLLNQGFAKTKTLRRHTAHSITCELPIDDVDYASADEAYGMFGEIFDSIESDMPCPELFEGALCVRSDAGRPIGVLYMGQTLVVAVSPEARGQGVGRKLYKAYADVREQKGKKTVFHEWISPDNTSSLAMFKKLGFTPDNVLTETYVYQLGA